jgi:hypothetical protein
MTNKKIINIDAEFEHVTFNERSINISTGKKINHPTKGKHLPKEWIDNVSRSLKGKKRPPRTLEHNKKYMRGVITPDQTFESVKACQDYYKISECTVRDRIVRGCPGWEYANGLTDQEEQLRKSWIKRKNNHYKLRSIQTPWGQYATRKKAVQAGLEQGIINPGGKIDKGIKTKPKEFYYVKK